MLQTWHLRGDFFQSLKRHLADACRFQSDGVTTVVTGTQGVQPDQFSRKVESHHLFLPIFRIRDRLERAFPSDKQCLRFGSGREQALLWVNGTAALDDPIQLRHVFCPDPGRQAQFTERALPAAVSQAGQIEYDCITHPDDHTLPVCTDPNCSKSLLALAYRPDRPCVLSKSSRNRSLTRRDLIHINARQVHER